MGVNPTEATTNNAIESENSRMKIRTKRCRLPLSRFIMCKFVSDLLLNTEPKSGGGSFPESQILDSFVLKNSKIWSIFGPKFQNFLQKWMFFVHFWPFFFIFRFFPLIFPFSLTSCHFFAFSFPFFFTPLFFPASGGGGLFPQPLCKIWSDDDHLTLKNLYSKP